MTRVDTAHRSWREGPLWEAAEQALDVVNTATAMGRGRLGEAVETGIGEMYLVEGLGARGLPEPRCIA